MRIPFIGGSDEGRSAPWNATRSINFFVEMGAQDSKSPAALDRHSRYEICLLHSLKARFVCFTLWWIGVSSWREGICTNFTRMELSLRRWGRFPIPVDTPIVAVDNGVSAYGVGGNQILMLANGLGYIFNILTNTLTQITDANFPANAHQVAFLDGYFIVTSKTMAFKVSALYDGLVWPSLATAAAVAAADNIQKPFGSNQVLYLVKDSTTEVWQDVAIPTSQGCPFAHIPGSLVNFGTVADRSIARVGDTVFMLGTTRVQDSAVYFGFVSVSGTAVEKISTPAIDYRVSRLTSLSDAISYSWVYEGHLFYVVTFPTDDLTLFYDATTKLWYDWSTHIEGVLFKQHRHLSNEYVFFGGKHLVSHYSDPKIYEMSSQFYDDDGVPIISIRTAQPIFDENENDNIKIFKLVIDAETGVTAPATVPGFNSAPPTAWLSWSNDGGRTWSSEYSSSLGKQGEFRTRLIWRRLGSPRNRVFRLKIVDPVKKVLLGAIVNNGMKP